MKWTEDGWLRMENGGNMAQEFVKESKLPEYPVKKLPQRDDFDSETLGIGYYAPRIDPVTFVDWKQDQAGFACVVENPAAL